MIAVTRTWNLDASGSGSRIIRVTVPVRTVSEANAHEHWRARQKRAKAQRLAVGLVVKTALADESVQFPLMVTLVRIAPRALDDDNLLGALKHVRDAVAEALALPNDRDPRVSWGYAQQRGAPKEYAVIVGIERA